MELLTLIEMGLLLLPKITVGVNQFVTWLDKLREAAKQTGIWTEAHQAAWRAGLLSHELRPEEIPDAKLNQ